MSSIVELVITVVLFIAAGVVHLYLAYTETPVAVNRHGDGPL